MKFRVMGETDLLNFYKNKLNELQVSDDKYIERVDKYLKDLIEDRHELVAENLRRGEKISDLQTALTDLQLSCFEERERYLNVTAENDKLKQNEKRLHENIYYLLSITKEKEVRDRIIYILDDPKVKIGYQEKNSNSGNTGTFKHKGSSDDFLKQQVHHLQRKLNEHCKTSQSKTDVLLADCRITLEQTKEKLTQNEEQIQMLQKNLHDAEELLKNRSIFSTSQAAVKTTEKLKKTHSINEKASSSNSQSEKKSHSILYNTLQSNVSEMRLSLVFLSKIITKCLSILSNVQASQVFMQAAKLSKPGNSNQKYVNETEVTQLQNYIRQCTCLSYEVNNALKALKKNIFVEYTFKDEINIAAELKKFEAVIEELAVTTAEVDLIATTLSQATFFDYLTAPKQSFVKFGVKEINNCSKYVADVNKVVCNLKNANNFVLKAVQFIEKIQALLSQLRQENQSLPNKGNQESLAADQQSSLNNREFSSRSKQQISQPSGTDINAVNFSIKFPKSKIIFSSSIETNDVVRSINKTLSKIKQIESGEYIKDNEFCLYLGEQVKALTEKLKELYKEYNMQHIQDQFSEYSSVTLSKLETIAKQSRDAVVSAEAQISAYRSYSKNLSTKLKDTEELLRVSINECLTLKHKLQKEKIQRATVATSIHNELQEKLQKVSDFDDLETAVKEVISSAHSLKETENLNKANSVEVQQVYSSHRSKNKLDKATSADLQQRYSASDKRKMLDKATSAELQQMYSAKFNEPESLVENVSPIGSSSDSIQIDSPYECLYCKQGYGHKLCDEKIKELRADNRKLLTELKLLQQEMKEDKKLSKMSQQQQQQFKATQGSANQSENLKNKLDYLELRNSSLLEQLKLERNRLKKMEKYYKFEIAGSKTDIQHLKTKIQGLEKQLMKAVLIYEHDKNDLELLKSVHTTAQNSKQAVEAVRHLKRKVYELETDIKHL